jgi:hypothetical protein
MIEHLQQVGLQQPVHRLRRLVVVHQHQLHARRAQHICARADANVLAVAIHHPEVVALRAHDPLAMVADAVGERETRHVHVACFAARDGDQLPEHGVGHV